jgi:hypothetical protein
MKILYIAHYKEGSGWSRAALDYILALDQNGFDVVCRNIQLTSTEHHVPERIHELESKSLDGVDVCIQHLLPHHMIGTKKFKKNILLSIHLGLHFSKMLIKFGCLILTIAQD